MDHSLFSLTDRVAIVTGSGRGIGKAIALAFADAGAHVVIAARTPADIEATASEVVARGRKTLAVRTDVTISTQMDALVQQTVREFGRLDIMVNNAGGSGMRAPITEVTDESIDFVMNANVKSAFYGSRAAARVMVEQKSGNIINMGSISAIVRNPNNTVYSAAKAAVVNLTKNLAVELGRYNIRANALVPGMIQTELTIEMARINPGVFDTRIKNTPLGRLGTPEEIAAAAVYLASDAAAYVTGAALVISGGLHTLVM